MPKPRLSVDDMTLLKVLIDLGGFTFPLKTSAADDRASMHAESLVVDGYIERLPPSPGTGTSYRITGKGSSAYEHNYDEKSEEQ